MFPARARRSTPRTSRKPASRLRSGWEGHWPQQGQRPQGWHGPPKSSQLTDATSVQQFQSAFDGASELYCHSQDAAPVLRHELFEAHQVKRSYDPMLPGRSKLEAEAMYPDAESHELDVANEG